MNLRTQQIFDRLPSALLRQIPLKLKTTPKTHPTFLQLNQGQNPKPRLQAFKLPRQNDGKSLRTSKSRVLGVHVRIMKTTPT